MVGTPVATMALIRGAWAPTSERSFTSTCSPVLLNSVLELDLGGMWDSRCVQSLPQLHLISRPGANDDNGHVGFLRCLHGLGEAGLVVAPSLASLGVVDVCLLTNGGLDAVQGSDTPVLALVDHVISVLPV